jgi:hypothetical protein
LSAAGKIEFQFTLHGRCQGATAVLFSRQILPSAATELKLKLTVLSTAFNLATIADMAGATNSAPAQLVARESSGKRARKI